MFSPADAFRNIPIHMSKVDVKRTTCTDLENKDEENIEDCCDGTSDDHMPLSDLWTGKTVFELIK